MFDFTLCHTLRKGHFPGLFVLGLILICSTACQSGKKPPSLLSADDPLPDPLVMKDGSRVTRPAQWDARRKEMLEDILAIQFGHMPDEIPAIKVRSMEVDEASSTEHSLRRMAIFTTVEGSGRHEVIEMPTTEQAQSYLRVREISGIVK